MWKHIALYAALFALGALALQWIDMQRMARLYPESVYDALLAAGFLALGVWIGARMLGRRAGDTVFDGNPKALAELGISPRKVAVLQELAAGLSNKEIARSLGVSPNTVKTHLARLYEKLGATRRTDAVRRARELGLLR
ncbi:response regulator transcription factor [Dyella sp.]|jgi:DNA-binding CsgD family transcriptional regulator|uniref:response regulator transcription factor n=1 Tax=Dyella sp. TaxID=1869338 RepID=UPI002D786BD5|nr:response regulator transcription factor [Dyella sp.]HET6432676.1 response regulator transcription factor [Dyella sp.]